MKEGKMGSIKKIYFILIVIFVFSSTTYAVDRMDVKPTRDQKIKIYRQFLKESKSTSNLELYVNKFFKYLPKETKDLSY
ncbi:MAG: hypothetical protein KDD50_10110, partial [Bdellovibrionales bacterium]|nr:hypothetical protein [Bdellovibrionales bacterium]